MNRLPLCTYEDGTCRALVYRDGLCRAHWRAENGLDD